jgi:hypothetical protein
VIGGPQDPTPLEAAKQAVLESMRIGRYDYGATDAYNEQAEALITGQLQALLAAHAAQVRGESAG